MSSSEKPSDIITAIINLPSPDASSGGRPPKPPLPPLLDPGVGGLFSRSLTFLLFSSSLSVLGSCKIHLSVGLCVKTKNKIWEHFQLVLDPSGLRISWNCQESGSPASRRRTCDWRTWTWEDRPFRSCTVPHGGILCHLGRWSGPGNRLWLCHILLWFTYQAGKFDMYKSFYYSLQSEYR